MPGARLLTEPGAGWWNNLFLLRKDGSVWTRLTNFATGDVIAGVLSPMISRDGKVVTWIVGVQSEKQNRIPGHFK